MTRKLQSDYPTGLASSIAFTLIVPKQNFGYWFKIKKYNKTFFDNVIQFSI